MSDVYKHYLTTEDTAQALKVSRRTLARYKSEGKIRPVTVKGKDLYDPSSLAHFSANSDSVQQKLQRQTAYNSHRIAMLEIRLSAMESLLELRTKDKLSKRDVSASDLRKVLRGLCTQPSAEWTVGTVEDILRDIARLNDDLMIEVGIPVIQSVIELAVIYARKLRHTRSALLVARAEKLLKDIISSTS